MTSHRLFASLPLAILLLVGLVRDAHADIDWRIDFPATTGYLKTNVVASCDGLSRTLVSAPVFSGSAGYANGSSSDGTAVGSNRTKLSSFTLTIPSFAPDYKVASVSVVTRYASSSSFSFGTSAASLSASVAGTRCSPSSSSLTTSSATYTFTPAANADTGDVVLVWTMPSSSSRTYYYLYLKSLAITLVSNSAVPALTLTPTTLSVVAGAPATASIAAAGALDAPLLSVDAAFADALATTTSSTNTLGTFAWTPPYPGEYAVDITAADAANPAEFSTFQTLRIHVGLAAPAPTVAVLNPEQATLLAAEVPGVAEYELSLIGINADGEVRDPVRDTLALSLPIAFDDLRPGLSYTGMLTAVNGAVRSTAVPLSFATPKIPPTLMFIR